MDWVGERVVCGVGMFGGSVGGLVACIGGGMVSVWNFYDTAAVRDSIAAPSSIFEQRNSIQQIYVITGLFTANSFISSQNKKAKVDFCIQQKSVYF